MDNSWKLFRVFSIWTWAYRKIYKCVWSHFQVFQSFFLSKVHFITFKVDSCEVVDSELNDNVMHAYPKEVMVGYASKNISLLLYVNVKIIDCKALFLMKLE